MKKPESSQPERTPRKNTRRRKPRILTVRRIDTKKAVVKKNTTAKKGTTSSSTKPKHTKKSSPKKKSTSRKPRSTGRPRRRSDKSGTLHRRPKTDRQKAHVPPLAPGKIRIIPLAGVEWIGTNMTVIEYMDEIIVIDIGFGFSNPDTPGIDYTIPDATYLENNKEKIKGVVITHGHMDHVGGIPYIIDRIGNPPIYTREFGAIFIKKRLEEFPHLPKPNIVTIDKDDGYLPVGNSQHLKVKFFGLTHSIPDSTGVIIRTPIGGIVSTGDVRVENTNGIPSEKEVEQYSFFKDEKIILMTMDSTGVEKPGWSLSENVVKENIDKIIKSTPGRLFIAAFSSQVERMISFMESAKRHGKYVAIEGRSMKSNLAIAERLKLTDFSHVIPISEINDYPPNKIVVLMTGGQGENFSALDRVGREIHRDIKLNENDTVVLSSSIVPGNDWQVKKLKDNLYRGSYHIITYADNQVHASGHGKREELTWIHKQIPYKFFMPIHGDHYMLKIHAKLAHELGVPKENIVVPDNGSIIEIDAEGKAIKKLDTKAPAEMVVVDGSMVGPLPEVVMRDRQMLGESGIFVIVATIDARTGKMKKSPDIISRGFIYLRENQELLKKARGVIKKTVEENTVNMNPINFDHLKSVLSDTMSKFLLKKTGKHPIIIPVILGL